jgi:uncharacterized membrane protein YjfL (UPF0719 family)
MNDVLSGQFGGLLASVVYSVVGVFTMLGLFWVVDLLTPFSIKKEITEDHNVALGIILGAFIVALGLIVSSAIRG